MRGFKSVSLWRMMNFFKALSILAVLGYIGILLEYVSLEKGVIILHTHEPYKLLLILGLFGVVTFIVSFGFMRMFRLRKLEFIFSRETLLLLSLYRNSDEETRRTVSKDFIGKEVVNFSDFVNGVFERLDLIKETQLEEN